MKALNGCRGVFNNARVPFSLLSLFQPKICGEVEGYEAEMGIVWEGESKALVCKVKLKNLLPMPWFFWDKFSLSDSSLNQIEIQGSRWLTKCIYAADTMREVRQYLERKEEDAIKSVFRHLVVLAGKIDRKEIALDSQIRKQANVLHKDILIVVAIVLVVILLAGWWIYH